MAHQSPPIDTIPTQPLRVVRLKRRPPKKLLLAITGLLLLVTLGAIFYPLLTQAKSPVTKVHQGTPTPRPTPTPIPFDPNVGAALPSHRIIAFYGIPNAEPTGPA